jgi:hypothetical protein
MGMLLMCKFQIYIITLKQCVVLLSIQVPEPISYLNVTRNYEKFIVMSTKCLQLWCVKHYCDFMSFIGFVE